MRGRGFCRGLVTRLSQLAPTEMFLNNRILAPGLQGGNVRRTVKHLAFSTPLKQILDTGPAHGGEKHSNDIPSSFQTSQASSVMFAYSSHYDVPAVVNHYILTFNLRIAWATDIWTTSNSGVTSRLCRAFELCQYDPLDMEAMKIR
jgi:beta-glucosidase